MTYNKIHICVICDESFIGKSNNSKYCSTKCVNKYRQIKNKKERLLFPEKVKQRNKESYLRNIDQKRKYAADKYHRLKNDVVFKEKRKISDKKCYIKHKKQYREKQNIYDLKHRTHLLSMKRKRNKSEGGRAIRIKWEKENREHIRAYVKQRKKDNPCIAIAHNTHHRIKVALFKLPDIFYDNFEFDVEEMIGCTIIQLKNYLESLFIDDMSWANYGYYGWHIDHKKPICSYDLTKKNERLECFNYKNLQPMWRIDNQSKGGRYDN